MTGDPAHPASALPRLGLVSYLNARPIGYGLLHGRQSGRFQVVEEAPSVLADELARGELDFALVPSVELARGWLAGRRDAIVPGISISSPGSAESVLFFARAPLGALRRIALDVSSRTSVALLRLLLRRRLRPGAPDPQFLPAEPDLPAMLERCEGALLIGDRALFARQQHPELVGGLTIHDLGREWNAMTRLPFVFAVWAGPARENQTWIIEALQDSLEEGLERIPEIARHHSAGDQPTERVLLRYLSTSIRYDLGRREIRGLETFYRMLSEEGLIEGSPPALVFHRGRTRPRAPR